MQEEVIRNELATYCRWLRAFGYNDSHSGNISARIGDSFLVTPTGACADTITSDDFIACPIEGEIPAGASGDAALHQAVYRANPDSKAVIHSHGAYSVAMTLNGETFIPDDFEGQLYFPEVPVVTVPYEVYFETAAPKVAEMLAGSRIGVVRGHGVYAHAGSLNLAYKWTCSLELSAKTAYIARSAGTVEPR